MSAAVGVAARPATVGDLDPLGRLADEARTSISSARGGAELLATDPRSEDLRAHLAEAIADPSTEVLVGTLDDVVVGYLLARLRPTTDGQSLAAIEELYVEPAARQVGVAAAVLARVLSWADQRGCRGVDAVALPGDRATKNFFEGHGLVARAIISHRSLDAATDGSSARR